MGLLLVTLVGSGCTVLSGADALQVSESATKPPPVVEGPKTVTCSGPCSTGQYESTACDGTTTDRVCSKCAPIEHCTSAVTCTKADDQQCTSCDTGFLLVEGTSDACNPVKSCADLKQRLPTVLDGVYTIDPDGPGGLDPFDVYCDMSANGGGWTLIGKVGNGTFPELSVQAYTDLIANPVADVGSELLMSGAMPAQKEIAFFRRDRTNAIYRATPYAGDSAVRVIFAQSNVSDGTYFQQRKVVDRAWDFWAAMRDARRWSSSTSGATWVSNFGADFVLTRNLAKFAVATNTVTHDTGGDTTFGWFASATLSLVDGTMLEVSTFGGLLAAGVNNYDSLYLLCFDPNNASFKNETTATRSTIWLR